MCKFRLRDKQMNGVAFVTEASRMAHELVRMESRGPGDLDNALHRIEARHGVPYAALWALRYRKPKDVGCSIFARLKAAYASECWRQEQRYQQERQATQAKTGIGTAILRAADRLAGQDDEALK